MSDTHTLGLNNSSNTPSGGGEAHLKALREQLVAAKAKSLAKTQKALKTKNRLDSAAGKENASPGAKEEPGKAGLAVRKAKKEAADSVRWADSGLAHLTDALLSKIEDSLRYRKVFGFSVGNANVTAGDMTGIKVCRLLVPEIFPESSPAALEKLAASIKARIAMLKSTYLRYRNELGKTGHGLIESNRESEISSGTPIYNVWQKMEVKFKWYKRLHLLLSTSPVYDHSGLANSATPVDLSALSQGGRRLDSDNDTEPENAAPLADMDGEDPLRGSSPAWNDEELDASFGNESMEVHPATSSSPPMSDAAAPPPPTSKDSLLPKLVPSKRKHPLEMLQVINESVQRVKIETTEIQAKSKLDRERLRISAEKERHIRELEEARERRQHERFMAEQQLELLRLQASLK